MHQVDLEFLKSIKAYIESREKTIEGEWGSCRELEELIEDGDMPTLYYQICEMIRSPSK